MIRIKRTYDPPAAEDGRRFLVERLWPRGMKKEALILDAWMKDVAPSTELRKWYGHEVDRWEGFRRRYREELAAKPETYEPILDAARRGTVTLLYSAHDTLHNGAVVLRDYLEERQKQRRGQPASRERKPSASEKRARTVSEARGRGALDTRGRGAEKQGRRQKRASRGGPSSAASFRSNKRR